MVGLVQLVRSFPRIHTTHILHIDVFVFGFVLCTNVYVLFLR